MRIRNRVAVVVSGAVLVGTASLLASLPTGLPAGAVKALSAPVFVGNATIKATAGKPLAHTLKAKANPVASISVVGALPPGVTFVPDDTTGTGLLADPTPLGGSYPITFQATNSQGTTTLNATLVVKSKLPPLRHVFVIMLENEGYNATFGGPNNYLNTALPAQGALLTNYYGVGHFSNDNYTGFISGQPPTADNQIDCLGTNGFTDFPAGSGLDANGIQQGNGCVYPAGVPTLADQLTGDGLTWKGYQEDMGNVPTRESATCGHPTVGTTDGTAAAVPGDGYASRHDPFVYFHSIIDNTTECNQDVVPLGDTSGNLPASAPAGTTGLVTDLQSVATTPNFSFITPNLCNDGHDYPCHNVTSPDTSAVNDISDWLQTWIPIIEASPAYQQDGLIEVTFDESDVAGGDATACCGETPGPAALAGGNGRTGPGGGRVGTILISPHIAPGLVVTKTSYNHYSSLASIEDLFGLPRLGEAKTVTTTFDKKIYTP
jgi:phosphatidylinositol-3-phosphatase